MQVEPMPGEIGKLGKTQSFFLGGREPLVMIFGGVRVGWSGGGNRTRW